MKEKTLRQCIDEKGEWSLYRCRLEIEDNQERFLDSHVWEVYPFNIGEIIGDCHMERSPQS